MRFKDPISHLKSHLGKGELELMRTTALSVAGFFAALIILLVQTKGQPPYSAVALGSSIASLLVWLFGAQYVSAYLVHGERTYKYVNIFLSAAISILATSRCSSQLWSWSCSSPFALASCLRSWASSLLSSCLSTHNRWPGYATSQMPNQSSKRTREKAARRLTPALGLLPISLTGGEL